MQRISWGIKPVLLLDGGKAMMGRGGWRGRGEKEGGRVLKRAMRAREEVSKEDENYAGKEKEEVRGEGEDENYVGKECSSERGR